METGEGRTKSLLDREAGCSRRAERKGAVCVRSQASGLCRVLLALTVFVPGAAVAWGSSGHEIIAAVAESRLTPEARRMVREIAGDTPLSDPDIATWADAQRDRATRPWHYVNIPMSSGSYDARRDCVGGACVVAAMERARADLVAGGSAMRRADALRWLVHLVADVHQPLHAGDGWDRGGNDFLVRVRRRRQPSNLHRVWDHDVVKPLLRHRTVLSAARMLAGRIAPADAERWAADLTPALWAEQSSREARGIYAELGRRPGDKGILRLPPDYAAAQRRRVEAALQRGGVRLAALLNHIASARRGGR